jgi:restriction system protein
MGRRRGRNLEGLLAIAAWLPWWLALLLAPPSYFALRHLANREVRRASDLEDLASVVVDQGVVLFAQIGQFALPAILVVGAVISLSKRAKSAALVNRFAGDPEERVVQGNGRASVNEGQASMSWREFEMLVAELFRRQGYRVAETARGADGGIDVECYRGAERFLVQCKHWSARLVDVKVVRELNGVIAGEKATGGAVVTTGRFTRDAIEFARRANVELIDGERLWLLARELPHHGGKPRIPDPVPAEGKATSAPAVSGDPACPRCGSEMVLRKAKRGVHAGQQFWGCRQYPKCKGTAPAPAEHG